MLEEKIFGITLLLERLSYFFAWHISPFHPFIKLVSYKHEDAQKLRF